MKTIEFIVPEGYENAGEIVEVPEIDAKHFDDKGWSRAEEKTKKKEPKK